VDDDSLVLMNTVLMVEALGHTVIEASSVMKRCESLNNKPLPEVLITDPACPT